MADAPKIRRWYISQGDCFEVKNGEWMLAEDVAKVFPPDVAFMPVPRCEHCQHWEQHDSFTPTGECRQIEANDNGPVNPSAIMPVEASLTTRSDFGCVLFQAKPQTDSGQ